MVASTSPSDRLAVIGTLAGAGYVGYRTYQCMNKIEGRIKELNELRAVHGKDDADKVPRPLMTRAHRVVATTEGMIGGATTGFLAAWVGSRLLGLQ